MKIGIDLSPIQGPHRMRGIGYTLINFINNIPSEAKRQHTYVFYVLPEEYADLKDPLSILDLTDLQYEVRSMQPQHRIHKKLPGRLNMLISALNALLELRQLRVGTAKNYDLSEIDAFLQADQAKSFPHTRGIKKILIIYDIIPYTLEWDYLWSYTRARQVKGYPRKAALRCQARRSLYLYKLRRNIVHADTLLAISQTTKRDFVDTFRLSPHKIVVTPLGVTEPKQDIAASSTLLRYRQTSWGYLPFPFEFDTSTPFILFVGGADRRRKLEDVVSAFNQLRAQGVKLQLVLAGDSMQGPASIATEEIQESLLLSSYLHEIIFMGFIDDATRDWLYKHALAFVFPSRYEGFGLPVLEAMSYGCPVISYRNDATLEVAGKAPIYADDAEDLVNAIRELLENPTRITSMKHAGFKQIEAYGWDKTAATILKQISA